MAAMSPEQVVTLVLSIFCGVLGVFLLTHKGVRLMKGGLLYRLSVGLAGQQALALRGRSDPLVAQQHPVDRLVDNSPDSLDQRLTGTQCADTGALPRSPRAAAQRPR